VRTEAPFAQSESAHWRKKIDINIYGTLYFTRGVINSMLEQNYGRIINIASVAGTYGLANMVDYSLTKGAILAFSKALAREVTGSGVLVNTVSPGNINPDPNFTPKSSYMNRSGHPRECAEAICFLASDKASFISGCDYVVDGCRRKL
jgi:NAD(P)-dependent dehydrogenase (short-subunit alcohol dehydrogenase family)